MRANRRFSRFLPNQSTLWFILPDGKRIRGDVVNESYGGIGVLVDDPQGIEEGSELTVEFEDLLYDAVVVACRAKDDSHLVGIKWVVEDSDENDEADEDERNQNFENSEEFGDGEDLDDSEDDDLPSGKT